MSEVGVGMETTQTTYWLFYGKDVIGAVRGVNLTKQEVQRKALEETDMGVTFGQLSPYEAKTKIHYATVYTYEPHKKELVNVRSRNLRNA